MNKVIKLSVMAGISALCVLFSASYAHADELLELYDSDQALFYDSSYGYDLYEDILPDNGGYNDGYYYGDILEEDNSYNDCLYEDLLAEEPLYEYELPYEKDLLEVGLADDLIEDPVTSGKSGSNKGRETPVVSNPVSGNKGNGPSAGKNSSIAGVTNEMSKALDAINSRRANAGAGKLTFSADLNRAAAARVKEITVRFSHVRPNGKTNVSILREFGIDYNCAGENIACCINSAEDAAAAWAASTTHSRCMLNRDYGHAGIGVTTVDGITYCVLILTD